MKHYIKYLVIILLFIACSDNDNRKVVAKNDTTTKHNKTSKTKVIANLPMLIDSTDFLIHPIGKYALKKSRSEYFSSDSYESHEFSSVSSSRDGFYGNLSNVKFQQIPSKELKALTTSTINITSMTFLRQVYNDLNKGYFLYEVNDKDTNADGTLNSGDLESLYISNLNGAGFRKLSPDRQELITWKVIIEAKTLYFKSIEDTDNNGKFDNKDTMHYYYLDLNQDNSKVIEYFPV
ncbi:hypothetical protein [Psychroserpens sp. MEBiC05023]